VQFKPPSPAEEQKYFFSLQVAIQLLTPSEKGPVSLEIVIFSAGHPIAPEVALLTIELEAQPVANAKNKLTIIR